jgi:hypothetical protein
MTVNAISADRCRKSDASENDKKEEHIFSPPESCHCHLFGLPLFVRYYGPSRPPLLLVFWDDTKLNQDSLEKRFLALSLVGRN